MTTLDSRRVASRHLDERAISLDATSKTSECDAMLRGRHKLPNNEGAIRAALRTKCLRQHAGKVSVLVINELGLAHARSRIDLAVFNGSLHGYEIKSANDTLYRLPAQLEIYSSALQKLTLVVATRHIDATFGLVPDWCGLVEIIEGPRGGIRFETRRLSRKNPNLDPFVFAHLLWRAEAQELLKVRGFTEAALNKSRKNLYRFIADTYSINELTDAIKSTMSIRKRWRDQM